jgi:hypothetical protein
MESELFYQYIVFSKVTTQGLCDYGLVKVLK